MTPFPFNRFFGATFAAKTEAEAEAEATCSSSSSSSRHRKQPSEPETVIGIIMNAFIIIVPAALVFVAAAVASCLPLFVVSPEDSP